VGFGGIAPRILTVGTRWRWVFSFMPWHFTFGERVCGAHWVCVRVGSRWDQTPFLWSSGPKVDHYVDWASTVILIIRFKPRTLKIRIAKQVNWLTLQLPVWLVSGFMLGAVIGCA